MVEVKLVQIVTEMKKNQGKLIISDIYTLSYFEMDKEQIKDIVREVMEEKGRKTRKSLSSIVSANFFKFKSKINRQRLSKGRVQKNVFSCVMRKSIDVFRSNILIKFSSSSYLYFYLTFWL